MQFVDLEIAQHIQSKTKSQKDFNGGREDDAATEAKQNKQHSFFLPRSQDAGKGKEANGKLCLH